MALLGFIGPDTYTTVTIVSYDYENKLLDIQAFTYTDSTKRNQIAVGSYQVALNHEDYRHVKGEISDLPDSPVVGDMYLIVNPHSDGPLCHANGAILKYGDDLSWVCEFMAPGAYIVNDDTGDVFMTGENNTRELDTDVEPMIDSDTWDAICGVAAIDGDQASLLACAYAYLKSLSEFSEVIDG